MSQAFHNIEVASQRSGLSTHVIRAWERRYRAVEPSRTAAQHRLYSDEQIERLVLLNDITRSGHRIGNVATMQTDELRKLQQETKFAVAREGGLASPSQQRRKPAKPTTPVKRLLDQCLACVQQFDASALERVLEDALLQLGSQGTLQLLIAPLAQQIGVMWREGSITSAHEHFATSVIQVFLAHAARAFAASEAAPVLIVATPTGQLHELGALLVGASAANLGWRVIYLGASLPAAEIAGAARQNGALAVALSLVYPEDDPKLEQELLSLRSMMPAKSALVIGGRAMEAYKKAVDKVTSHQAKNLSDLNTILDALRKPATK